MRAINFVTAAALIAGIAGVAVAQPTYAAGRMVQVTKMVCKTTRNSPITQPPECHGGTAMDSGPVCICPGGTQEFELPACNADGSPAMHPSATLVPWRDKQRMIVCAPYRPDGSGGPRGY